MSSNTSEIVKTVGARNEFLDSLRGFAILGVVCIHFGGSFAVPANAWTPSFYFGLALNQFFSFAVPLFVFVSGLLASPYRATRNENIFKYYVDRIKVIGWPYAMASIAAFLLLRVRHDLEGMISDGARIEWLLSRFFYYGIHPTFYFIPMITALYFLRPLLSWVGPAAHHFCTSKFHSAFSLRSAMLMILGFLLAAHLLLAFLCKRGDLNFYAWCRPNPFFWAFYFYFGLIFPVISNGIPPKKIKLWLVICLPLIILGYATDWNLLTDPAHVGDSFEHSGADYTYVNYPVVFLNILVISFVAVLLVAQVSRHSPVLSFLGKNSLHIYLWHILLLYIAAWSREPVLAAVRQAPELIVGIAFFTALVIASLAEFVTFSLSVLGRYRLRLRLEKSSQ